MSITKGDALMLFMGGNALAYARAFSQVLTTFILIPVFSFRRMNE